MTRSSEHVRHHVANVLLFVVIAAWFMIQGGEMFEDLPPIQSALSRIAGVLWLGGGLVLIRSSHERVRRTGGPRIRSWLLPFFYFNKREWLILLALFATVATLAMLGVLLDPIR